MKVIWAKSPISAGEVIATLSDEDQAWHPKTTKTFLARLVKKGALSYEKVGRAYLYEPLVTQAECVSAESESFLVRLFGGSLAPMLSHFVEHKKLSKKEINQLKQLLNGGLK